MKKIKFLSFSFVFTIISCFSLFAQQKSVQVEIKTTQGTIIVKLYNETPLHKANFIKLVNEKYYDGMLFHRVIKEFMIQTGDPNSKTAKKGQMLGSGGPIYTINAEFKQPLFHKKGALSAARQGDDVNPQKKSSGSQFYIVQGKKYTAKELDDIEYQLKMTAYLPYIREYLQKPENKAIMSDLQQKEQKNDRAGVDKIVNGIILKIKPKHPEIKEFKFSKTARNIYQTVGGTPFLDMNYTVFGEVVKGLDVLDKIANSKTDKSDRPIDDVKVISMKVLK
jgi:cyclophilin family peptidyl-prolyl cis-trans isomerase